eukprot:5640518-Pleurochrysis_carterae.AAC.3
MPAARRALAQQGWRASRRYMNVHHTAQRQAENKGIADGGNALFSFEDLASRDGRSADGRRHTLLALMLGDLLVLDGLSDHLCAHVVVEEVVEVRFDGKGLIEELAVEELLGRMAQQHALAVVVDQRAAGAAHHLQTRTQRDGRGKKEAPSSRHHAACLASS